MNRILYKVGDEITFSPRNEWPNSMYMYTYMFPVSDWINYSRNKKLKIVKVEENTDNVYYYVDNISPKFRGECFSDYHERLDKVIFSELKEEVSKMTDKDFKELADSADIFLNKLKEIYKPAKIYNEIQSLIEYRAWDYNHSEYVTNVERLSYMGWVGSLDKCNFGEVIDDREQFCVEPYIMANDKNGIKIFMNDILYKEPYHFYVTYDRQNLCWILRVPNDTECPYIPSNLDDFKTFSVVGNIHQNFDIFENK